MKLQTKVSIIVTCAWLSICLIIYGDSRWYLSTSYASVEKNLVEREILDAQLALNTTFKSFSVYSSAWAFWDDMYAFMENKNERFIRSTFQPGAFESSDVDFFVMYDMHGDFYFGIFYDANKNKITNVPESLLMSVKKNNDIILHNNINSIKQGMLSTPDGLVMIASLPILTSDKKGPARGTLLMGSYVNKSYFNNLSASIGLPVAFYANADISKNKSLNNIYIDALNRKNAKVILSDENTAHGYLLLNDMENHPIGMIKIDVPRVIYLEKKSTLKHYFIVIVAIGFFVVLLLWYLLKLFVLDRILDVSQQVQAISRDRHFNNHIQVKGGDEVAGLVKYLNSLIRMISISQKQLTFMATHDPLTKLPNREYFNHLLSESLLHAKKTKTRLAIFFIDMDRFKNVNDHFGHAVGDQLLEHTARRIAKIIRQGDVVARQSGDEFIVSIANITDLSDVAKRAESLLSISNSPFSINGHKIQVLFSIGISVYPDDALTAEELMDHADSAMYAAKRVQGNTYCFYDDIQEMAEYEE